MSALCGDDRRLPLAVLGAGTLLGQTAIGLLENHPWFTLTELFDIDARPGWSFAKNVNWQTDGTLADAIGRLPHKRCGEAMVSQFCLSVLPDGRSAAWDRLYAEHGAIVVSHAEECRLAEDFTLVLPELNGSILVECHPATRLFATPNCTTVMMALPLHAIDTAFGVDRLRVTCLQAVSGADLPGYPYLAIADNILPDLIAEELALERELNAIFGGAFTVEARAARVPVAVGHVILASADLRRDATVQGVEKALKSYRASPLCDDLPTALANPIRVVAGKNRPQPASDIWADGGMTVAVGGVALPRPTELRFTVAGNNLVRGAAGTTLVALEAITRARFPDLR